MKNLSHSFYFIIFILAFSFTNMVYAQETLPIPIHHWPGNDDANDIVGGANGTLLDLNGKLQFGIGLVGNAFDFDGQQSSVVTLPVNISGDVYPQFTMGMFVKLKSVFPGSKEWVIGHDNGGFDRALILHDSRFGNGLAAGAGFQYTSTLPALLVEQWYAIAVSYDIDEGLATVYIKSTDGTWDKTNQWNVEIKSTAWNQLGLPQATLGGLQNYTGHAVNALVDEVFMYKGVVSSEQLDIVFADLLDTGILPDFLDETPPVITAPDITVNNDAGNCSALVEYTVTVTDNEDPKPALVIDHTSPDTYPVGETVVTCTATDESGNISVETFTVTVLDAEVPVITLNGDNPMEVSRYTPYVEPGATVTDNCDPDPELTISGSVDSNLPGSYTIIYNAVDDKGNASQLERIVNVVNKELVVTIDVKPGSDNNPINIKSKGVIPVAVLTTDEFDAADVDVSKVTFGPAAASPAHGGHREDVDGDGDVDLVLHFRTQETGISNGDTEVCLSGITTDEMEFTSCDDITTEGKLKKENDDIAILETPTDYALLQNYPNPFNPSTTISYSLPEAGYVKLAVYNSLGQEVALLVDGSKPAGHFNVDFNAADLNSGIYFYKLATNNFIEMKKMMLVK